MQSTDIFLRNLAELVERKCGIPFTQEKISLYLNSIFQTSTTISKMNYYDYLSLLESSSLVEENEWKNVLKALNISETYFFRDISQLNFLQTTLLPNLIREKSRESRLSFWSAGCSTGEEVYTLAFLLTSLQPDSNFVFRILGSDFNDSSIQFAKHAKYSAWSLRAIPDTNRSLYFTEHSDTWEVNPTYRTMVDFRLEDLLNIEYYEEFDFILCRNVFIYLNEATKRRIMERFANALRPGGYLVLGHSEAGLVIPKSLKATNHSTFLYYAKSLSNEILPSLSMELGKIIPDTEPLQRNTSPKNSLQIAIQLANLGKLKDARESCLSILSKEEDNYEALYWLGYILEAEGDYLSAEIQYGKSLKIKEDFLETYISLSSLYTVLGRDMESESVKKACLKVLSERCDLQTMYERKGLDMNKLQRYLETKKEIWVA